MPTGWLAVAALCLLLGRLLLGRQAAGLLATPGFLPVVWFLAGAVTLHALLLALSLFDLSWSWLTLGLPLAALLAIAPALDARRRRGRRRRRREARLPAAQPRGSSGETRGPGWGPGWGDLVALLALAAFAVFAWNCWVTTADFFLHWGNKGREFFHAGRLDYGFLSHPWSWRVHADYPTLLPELYALTALFSGRFHESAMMLWAVLWLVLIVLSARETLQRAGVPPPYGQATVALLAAAMAAAGIALKLAGGADWMIALALLAASPDLVGAPPASRDLTALDLAAAFAASAKEEGVTLAALLLAASAIRDRRARGGWDGVRIARSVTPSLVVGGLWLFQAWRHGLRPLLAVGAPAGGGLRVVASESLAHLASPTVYGLQLWILALPLLLVHRRTRWLGGIACMQLLVCLCVYLGARGDVRFLVASTVDRLLWQLLPAVVVGAVIALVARSAATLDRTAAAAGTEG
jgi:hypothetical protein